MIHVDVNSRLTGTVCACVIVLTFCLCALMLTARQAVAELPRQMKSTSDVLVRSLQDEILRTQTQMDDREKRVDAAVQELKIERRALMFRK